MRCAAARCQIRSGNDRDGRRGSGPSTCEGGAGALVQTAQEHGFRRRLEASADAAVVGMALASVFGFGSAPLPSFCQLAVRSEPCAARLLCLRSFLLRSASSFKRAARLGLLRLLPGSFRAAALAASAACRSACWRLFGFRGPFLLLADVARVGPQLSTRRAAASAVTKPACDGVGERVLAQTVTETLAAVAIAAGVPETLRQCTMGLPRNLLGGRL